MKKHRHDQGLSDRQMFGELFRCMKPYRGRFMLAAVFAVAFAALNSSIPLIIKQVAGEIFPQGFNKSTIRAAAVEGTGPQLGDALWLFLLVPLIMIVRGLVAYLNAYQMSWITLRVVNDIRTKLFRRVMLQDMDFFDQAKAGFLMSRIMNSTQVLRKSVSALSIDLLKQPIALLGGIGVLFYLDWRFSLVALVLFPICILPVIFFGRKVRKAGLAEESLAGRMNIILQESFSGIRVIKSFAAENYVNSQFLAASDWQFRKGLRVQRSLQLTTPIVEITAAFGVSLALVFVYWTGMGAATFLALLAGIFLLYQPAKALSQIHVMLQKCLTAMTHVFELMHREPAVQDRPDAVAIRSSRGALAFDGVSFSYGPEVAALQAICLQIEPGQRVALVGSSGAGKSTLLSLILRFYDPQEGAVLIDGHDLRCLSSIHFQIYMRH
jgi:subfamily B ATP-binding cassette protein MsbA